MTNDMERWEPVEAAQLRVGDYIRIDHRWFDHPFVRRMFRISSEQEITTMRDMQLTRIFVDHNRQFDNEPAAAAPASAPASAPAPAPAPAAAEAPAAETPAAGTAAAGDAAAPAADAGPDPAEEEARLAEQREALAAAHARDRVTRQRALEMLATLGSGDAAAAAAMSGYVDYLVAILNNSTTPLAPIAPTAPRHSMTRLALLGSDAVWLAGTIGKRMHLDKPQLRALTHAAAAHAAGLTRLPPNLMEEEPGTAATRNAIFAGYPTLGVMILEQCGGFSADVLRIVREHREHPDGSGFPHGLTGDAIHPHALILGAVRELQVRCADGAVSPAVALAGIHRQLKATYGAQIVNHLAASLLIFPVGTYVQLSDGRTARILRINEAARVSPVVEVFGQNAELQAPDTVDLSHREGLFIVRALDTSKLPPRMFEPARRGGSDAEPPPRDAQEGRVESAPEVAPAAAVAGAQASGA